MKDKTNFARELKRRGYLVTNSAAGGLLVERDTFWGKFSYDTETGVDSSNIKWGRTLLLVIAYGLGIIGGLYWLYKKGALKKEVLSVVGGE